MRKSIIMKTKLLSAFIALIGVVNTNAQTMTGSVTTQPCNNNGVCVVNVVGLTPPINYTYWSGNLQIVHNNVNSLSDQLTGFPANSYASIYCQATDGVNFVSNQFSYTVPFYVSTSSSNAVCPSTTGTLTASTFSGTPGPFTYNWTDVVTLATYTGSTVMAPIGQYSLMVTDQVTGCTNQVGDSSVYIAQSSNINITYSTTAANCNNGTASVVATGGVLPYTYQWNTGANTSFISNLLQGSYSATVTDAQGCVNNNSFWNQAYVQQSVIINVNSSVTNATCVQNNGSAIAFASGGMPPYTYAWSNGQTAQTLLAVAGGTYYNVIATDANGCIGSGMWISIGVNTPVTVTYTANASSCNAPTGSATLTISGGTPPYTTVWNSFSGSLTNTTISGVISGQYSFTVTDAAGCIQIGQAYVPPVSNIYADIYPSNVTCPSMVGNIFSNVSGTNPPFTYNWSNGSTAAQINNVPLGNYSCVITDAIGCSVTKYTGLYSNSPVNIGLSATQASCKFTADGSIIANATGGTAPYTYNWSNGQSGATASGLLTGNFWVTATDANGCLTTDQTFVGYNAANTSCTSSITVLVYQDLNGNCIKDAGEPWIPNIMIHCSNFGYAFTNSNGTCTFLVPPGTYTLSESVNSHYPLATCQSNSIVTPALTAGALSLKLFANNMLTQHDLHIITTSYCSVPVPGNPYYQRVIVENHGTVQESGTQISYVNDSQLGALAVTPSLFTQQDAANYPDWYSVQSGFPVLAPTMFGVIDMTYNTPTNIPLGTLVNFYDSTAHMSPINTSWLLDETPWDNVENYQKTVVASFDPNFKEVSPQGNGPQGYIASKDSILSYVIHFQNEGTYFAQNISVVDTLDADLDWSTLHPGYADHNYTTTVSENGVITFKFANINLPWKSQYGDVMSSGMVTYTIKRKRNVAQGTQFKNTAAIYFDYNAPVITNTTLNTLNDVLASVEEKSKIDNSDVVLYPNPASDNLSVVINSKGTNKGLVNILDITGKILSSHDVSLETGKNLVSENTSDLPSGIYFVQVKCNESFITKKLVVIK